MLDLIERWQHYAATPECGCPRCVLIAEICAIDISALRALAEQHAAQLRGIAAEELGGTDVLDVNAAADFLAAPRREQEGE